MKCKHYYLSLVVCVFGYTTAVIHPPQLMIGEGQSATFTCKLNSSLVVWYKNNYSLPNHVHVDGKSMQIGSATLNDNGIYQCVGNDPKYGHMKAKAILVVQKHRKKYVLPQRLVVQEGESAHFDCIIKTDFPLTWYKDNNPLPHYVQQHRDRISILKVSKADGGTYECMGKERKTQMYIKGLATLIFGIRDNSLISPQVLEVEVNSDVKLFCYMNEDVQWRFNEGKIKINTMTITGKKGSVLEMIIVQSINDGVYECSGKINGKYFVAESFLRVFDSSKVTPETRIAREGEEITFRCLHDDLVIWNFNDKDIPSNSFTIGNVLKIHNVKVFNTGYYVCHAMSNKNQKLFSARAILSVLENVVQVNKDTFSPNMTIRRVGDSVRFTCKSSYKTEWRFEGKPLPMSSSIFYNGTNILEIQNLKVDNSGIYSCFGMQDDMYFESEGELIVMEDCPKLDVLHGNVEEHSQYLARIRCQTGYFLNRPSSVHCDSTGESSSTLPDCEATSLESNSMNIVITSNYNVYSIIMLFVTSFHLYCVYKL